MPTFQATEPMGAYGKRSKVDDSGPPRCSDTFLPNRLDGVYLLEYVYRAPQGHGVQDLLRVGYFDSLREQFNQQFRAGGEVFITALIGNRDDGLTELRLHVVEAKSARDSHVVIAKGDSRSFTLARHDCGHQADKPPKP